MKEGSMRPRFLTVLFAAFLAAALLAGCGGGDSDDSDEAATAPASSSAVPFDRSFIDAMVPHHESATEMAEAAKPRLTQPDLIQVADDIVASQQAEIDRMLDWREDWFGSREVDPEGPPRCASLSTRWGWTTSRCRTSRAPTTSTRRSPRR
jgi:uncharacterized protein (DUF305 family)